MRIPFRRLISKAGGHEQGSVGIRDKDVIESFCADPTNTFLVSFPRTGSHWVRMLMELYFERPSLLRAFYHRDRMDYLTLHTHDLKLDIERSHVIYLYRHPVDTIFSQLRYHGESAEDADRILHWSDLYGRHLEKWLIREHFTRRKTTLAYEEMKEDLVGVFRRVTDHFDASLDESRLLAAAERVTKDEVKRRASHDPQAVQESPEYEMARQAFRERNGHLVWQALTRARPHLLDILPYSR